jgi:glycolate oxidase FAD binding subunit
MPARHASPTCRVSDPMQVFTPESSIDVANIVRDTPGTLEIIGTGSRRGYGRPVIADAILDTSRLTGIIDYDPAELVLTARPGTTLDELTVLVTGRGQCLAFEPPDFSTLFGSSGGTLGGALAMGLAGPRRPAAGSARDHFLGFEAVNGSGEIFRAGGKVIKNVTGYDLPKLLAGSLGTLAVLTEVTVKVLPAPPRTATLAINGLTVAQAVAAMTVALNSSAAVSGAAHLPHGDTPRTLLRLEGVAVSVAARVEQLSALLAVTVEVLDDGASHTLWAQVRDVAAFARPGEIIWRVSLPPSAAPALVAALPAARALVDWGGGLVWLFLPPAEDGHAPAIRAALASVVAPADGHATLFRAPDTARAAQSVFQPLEPGLALLSERVRQRFDPRGIFNPGRLYGTR